MTAYEFSQIAPTLNEEFFQGHTFLVTFECQFSILNVITEKYYFKATDKDDLCVQVDEYITGGNSACGPYAVVIDIAILGSSE